jgi:secondary thiamine-phosphate synthase enzyme
MIGKFEIETPGKGLWEVTSEVAAIVRDADVREGLATVFIRHTSASLTIQENADPSVRRDLQSWMERNVPENDPDYTHTAEGPDDMPSHIRSALTSTSIGIPIVDGRLVLGTWQGIYVWEHRARPHRRKIVVHVGA